MRDILSGVLPVLETPFDRNGGIDIGSFATLVRHVRGAGADGVMFPGFASEFAFLGDDERRELLEALVEVGGSRDDFTVIASVPDHSTRRAVEQAEFAVGLGADALNVLPPHFLSPSRESIVDHVRAILVAVDPTPVIVQFAPALTSGVLGVADLAALAGEHENFACVKVETMPPGRTVGALLALAPALTCLVGYAGIHLPDALERGATGVQPGSSFVELYSDLRGHWTAGRRAEFDELHRRLLPYLSTWMTSVPYIVQVEKTISRERGLIATDICREPGYRLDMHERRMIDSFLGEFGDRLRGVA